MAKACKVVIPGKLLVGHWMYPHLEDCRYLGALYFRSCPACGSIGQKSKPLLTTDITHLDIRVLQ